MPLQTVYVLGFRSQGSSGLESKVHKLMRSSGLGSRVQEPGLKWPYMLVLGDLLLDKEARE